MQMPRQINTDTHKHRHTHTHTHIHRPTKTWTYTHTHTLRDHPPSQPSTAKWGAPSFQRSAPQAFRHQGPLSQKTVFHRAMRGEDGFRLIQSHRIDQARHFYYSHTSCNFRPSGTGTQTLGIPCPEEMSVLQGAQTLPVVCSELQVTEALSISQHRHGDFLSQGRQPLSLFPAVQGTMRAPWCSAVSAGSQAQAPARKHDPIPLRLSKPCATPA